MSDSWKNIKNIIGKVCPILGNAVVPGIGGVAGSMISKMLGCDPNDPKAIEEKLKTDPDIFMKLKELETKHEEFLITSAQENDKLYIDDIKDARSREIEYTKATGEMNWPLYTLAGLVTLGFFITIICLFRFELIAFNKELIIYTVGGLQSAFITVVAYFFGSSKGSSDKNKILDHKNKLIEK